MAASKREKELARQRAERQAARRAAAAARRRQRNAVLATVVAVAVVAVGVVALVTQLSGGSSTAAPVAAASSPSAAASAAASPAVAGGCAYEDAGKAARAVTKPPTTGVERTGTFDATVTMNVGTVVYRVDAAKTPCSVNSLRSLAHFSYFDGTPCHRLTSQGIFVLQCGDPTGTGTGGPGYRFADEALTGATYPRGTVAMANSGKDTNGSQFFLVYKDSPLPPNYTPLGKITKGLDVLDAVAKAGSTPAGDGKPKKPVTITRLRTSRVAA